MASKVYFSHEISPAAVLRLYRALELELPGKVAVKVHSGEAGNQNFLHPAFMQPAVQAVNGTIVECNTAYPGKRNTNEVHWQLMEDHGWTKIAPVDILDAEGETELDIPHGVRIQKNYVGSHLSRYDSLLVLSHFKGHPMGGYGGALKNISIGLASSHGKSYIHGAGDLNHKWDGDHNAFLDSMADAAWSVDHLYKGRIAYVNIMCNMSVDCDCCAVAADPKIGDIGTLSSTDPVALDQACIDLVYASDDPNKADLIERIESRNGLRTILTAARNGIGSRTYDLIFLD